MNQHMLLSIVKANTKLKKILIKNCEKDIVLHVLEIIKNTLNGNISLKHNSTKQRLAKYKSKLRKIILSKQNLPQKRKDLALICKAVGIILENFFASSTWEHIQNAN